MKIATTMHQDSPEISILIKMEDVKQNVPIDESKFNKPAGATPAATPAPAMK